jgi:hypothetical protein
MRGEMYAFYRAFRGPHGSPSANPHAIKRDSILFGTSWSGPMTALRTSQLHAESMAPLILSFSPKGRRDRKVTLHLPQTCVES